MTTSHLKLLADWLDPALLGLYILQVCRMVHPIKTKVAILIHTSKLLLLTFSLAHINRWAHLWPGHYYFPSGHMTFYVTVASSYFLLDRRSALFTIPLALLYGQLIVFLNFHTWLDIAGALILAIPVTLLFQRKSTKQEGANPTRTAPTPTSQA